MKAKDIALLCTAAAGAGAAVSTAASAALKAGAAKKPAVKNSRSAEKNTDAGQQKTDTDRKLNEMNGFERVDIPHLSDARFIGAGSDCETLTAIVSDSGRLRAFRAGGYPVKVSEVRCPINAVGAASDNDCTLFITEKGGIFVYDDEEKEPVLCVINTPEYVCCFGGEFYVFSDSFMYVCTKDGEIRKTVSLCAMLTIESADVCDAERSDDSFSSQFVKVKQVCPISERFAAVVLDDGRSFIMDIGEDFYSFERAYDNIIGVCVFGEFAYYLAKAADSFNIIKMRIGADECSAEAKYKLCGQERTPTDIYSGRYGIGIVFDDGGVKFLLPEIADENERENCRETLRGINGAFADNSARALFTLSSHTAVLNEKGIYYLK